MPINWLDEITPPPLLSICFHFSSSIHTTITMQWLALFSTPLENTRFLPASMKKIWPKIDPSPVVGWDTVQFTLYRNLSLLWPRAIHKNEHDVSSTILSYFGLISVSTSALHDWQWVGGVPYVIKEWFLCILQMQCVHFHCRLPPQMVSDYLG